MVWKIWSPNCRGFFRIWYPNRQGFLRSGPLYCHGFRDLVPFTVHFMEWEDLVPLLKLFNRRVPLLIVLTLL
jgi:hypothetical protein